MKLTESNKKYIDNLSYQGLLSHWRFSPIGDRWFEGETGEYWSKRMKELRDSGADHVGASKAIMSERDCIHGHQARKCEICDLQRRLALVVEGLKEITRGKSCGKCKAAYRENSVVLYEDDGTYHSCAEHIAAETLRKVEEE